MAPTILEHSQSSTTYLRHLLVRSVTALLALRSDSSGNTPPLASVFALVIGHAYNTLSSRSDSSLTTTALNQLDARTSGLALPHPQHLSHLSVDKRQTIILAIPTTYAGLNAGPAPGVIVGIMLGSIAGFVLVLFAVLSILRVYMGRTTTEEVITTRRRRSRSRSQSMSEAPAPTRRERRETVIEERVTRNAREPDPVVEVEEDEEDFVEVIEEHSPERPRRRESGTGRKSGYRVVDPAELGGGSGPRRKVGRR